MENRGKKIRNTMVISASIPISVNERMEAYIDEREKSEEPINRSIVITKALKNFLAMIECPACHRMTMPENYCSHCGAGISISERDRKMAEFLYYEQHPEHAPDKDSKDIIMVSLTDDQIRRLLNGDIIEQAKVSRVDRRKYSENIHAYITDRREDAYNSL